MSQPLSCRIYRFLSRVLPADFRTRHGDELAASFADQLQAARVRRGRAGVAAAWVAAIADLVAHAIRLRHGAPTGGAPRTFRRQPASGRFGGFDRLARELRAAARALRRSPGYSAVSITTLALGIGSSVALFSVLYGVVLRPLPYPDPDRLVQLWGAIEGQPTPFGTASLPDLDDWRAASTGFEALAGYSDDRLPLGGIDEPTMVEVGIVTEDFFRVLGVAAARGRVLDSSDFDPAADRVAVMSDATWRTRFGAESMIGKTVRLGEETFTVVGVLGQRDHMLPSPRTELWVGLQPGMSRGSRSLDAVGRLRSGVRREAVQDDLDAITASLAARFPDSNAGRSVDIVPLATIVVGDQSRSVTLLFGAAAVVLVIAITNVVGVVRVRLVDRGAELAVRTALGASRVDLVAHLVSEAVLLAAAAGVLGVAIARLGVDAFLYLAPPELPRLGEVRVDGAALGFAVALTLLVATAVGASPLLRSPRGPRASASSPVGRHGWLVAAQAALCVVLLVAAGLLLRSFDRLQRVDPGFDPRGIVSLRLQLPGSRYETAAHVVSFHESVIERAATMSRVVAAGGVTVLPFGGGSLNSSVSIDGVERDDLAVEFRSVSGDYFRALNIELAAGRAVDARDTRGTELVTTINRALAESGWPGEDPIGRTITIFDRTWRVVGVIGDLHQFGFDVPPAPEMYVSFRQQPRRYLTHVVKVDGDPETMIPALRKAVHDGDPELAIASLERMEALLWQSAAGPRFRSSLLAALAAVALALAGVGVFGVASFTVSRRTREIGIRRALGARTGSIVGPVIARGMSFVALGTAAGVVAAGAFAGYLRSLLFEIEPLDPAVFAGAIAVIAAAAFAGCVYPALRAAAVDPMSAIGSKPEPS